MLELSSKRIDQILQEETPKTVVLSTVLRAIYYRYMTLYERYFAQIESLNDEKIAELRKYHEETRSLFRYYYMDIPQDVCMDIEEFEKKHSDKILGSVWRGYLDENYQEFVDDHDDEEISESALLAEFKKMNLEGFYDEMEDVFRDGFGTGSKHREGIINGLSGLLFNNQ